MNKTYKIAEAETFLVDVPVSKEAFPFSVSYGRMDGLKRVFLKLTAENNEGKSIVGWGEASPLYPYSNETPLSVYELLRFNYSNVIKGTEIDGSNIDTARKSIDGVLDKMQKYLSRERLNFTQTAIDFALYDLAGKAAQVPAYRLLSDITSFNPIKACWSTSSGSIDKAVESAKEYLKKGYAIKIKLSGDIESDSEITKKVLDESKKYQGADIRADANAGYTPENFRRYCQNVASRNDKSLLKTVDFYVEEPIDTREYGMDALIDIIKQNDFRIMADETLYTMDDAIALIDKSSRAGVLDKLLFNIKVQKVGGLRNAMRVGNIAKQYGIPVMIGGMFPSSHGKLSNCHYAIALGGVMASDGLHPSKDYIDTSASVVKNFQELELMNDGSRILDVFQDVHGFGSVIDEDVIRKNAINIDFGSYYPDFKGFKI